MFSSVGGVAKPGVKVWNLTAASSANNRISLEDDCASVQIFIVGGTTGRATVSLPQSPVPGKTITLKLERGYGTYATSGLITVSDSLSTNRYTLYPPACATFVYAPDISGGLQGSAVGAWVRLDSSSSVWSKEAGNFVGNFGDVTGTWTNSVFGPTYSVLVGGQANAINSEIQGAVLVGGGGSGEGNTVSNNYAAIVGGRANNASGLNAFIGGGRSNTASGDYTTIAGGQGNQATGAHSTVLGGGYATTRAVIGRSAIAACNAPISTVLGTTQASVLLLARETTTATPIVLTSNSSVASSSNQIILAANSALIVRGFVVANVSSGGDTKAWEFTATFKRGSGTASTAIVGTVIKNVLAADSGAATWDIAVTAETSIGAIKVEVTGAAATTIRWTCKLETTEVSF